MDGRGAAEETREELKRVRLLRKKEQTNKEYYREILLANRDKVGVKPMTYAEDDDAEDAEKL